MKTLFFFCTFMVLNGVINAQDFITRGKIEYEVKRNNKRMYSSEEFAESPFVSALPQYDISYYDLIFSLNRSIYQPGRKGQTPSEFASRENSVYIDLDQGQTVLKWQFIDEYYVYTDSLHPVKWRIENETRKIAGWECRKAVGRIDDSVYVVAFYCPEIIPQSGPELFTGLPGMILGLAIPRYFTTWFATKIELASIDESKIVPPTIKKARQYTKKELAETVYKKYKDSDWWKDVTLDKVMQMLSKHLLL